MPEEAAEQVVVEVAKELFVKGVGVSLKFGGTIVKAAFNYAANKVHESRNTGRMSVKRLYKVSNGNLAQIKLEQQDLIKDLEQGLKKHGVNYSIETNTNDGSTYLHVSGSDVKHATHIIDQILAKHQVISNEELAQHVEEKLANTAEFPAVTTENEVLTEQGEKPALDNPESLDFVPTSEEAEYMEAMGFEEQSDREVLPEFVDYNEAIPDTVDFVPTSEEAEYMEAMGFEERPPYMSDQTIEADTQEQTIPTDTTQEQRAHEATEVQDVPEHTETVEHSTQVLNTDDADMTTPDDHMTDDLAEVDTPTEAVDTRQETTAKRTKGRTEKNLTTKQKLKQVIAKRAHEKMAKHNNSQQRTHDLKHQATRSTRK